MEYTAKRKKTVTHFYASKQTILIIDDDSSMRWFVLEIFVNAYNVLAFNNPKGVLANLEVKQPDLIISDVMIPEIDGLSFARHIKQNKLWDHRSFILLSVLHHEKDQVKGIEPRTEAYVTKPSNMKYLEQIARRLIERESDLKEYYNSIYSS